MFQVNDCTYCYSVLCANRVKRTAQGNERLAKMAVCCKKSVLTAIFSSAEDDRTRGEVAHVIKFVLFENLLREINRNDPELICYKSDSDLFEEAHRGLAYLEQPFFSTVQMRLRN